MNFCFLSCTSIWRPFLLLKNVFYTIQNLWIKLCVVIFFVIDRLSKLFLMHTVLSIMKSLLTRNIIIGKGIIHKKLAITNGSQEARFVIKHKRFKIFLRHNIDLL